MSISIGHKESVSSGGVPGKLESMFFSENKGCWVALVRYDAPAVRMNLTTPVEIDPGVEPTTIFARSIPGWMSLAEMTALFGLAKEADGPIVEIGSFLGKSTVCLGWGARLGLGVDLFAIDTHIGSEEHKKYLSGSQGTYPTFMMNLEKAGLVETIVPIVCDSLSAASGFEYDSLSLVFVDGDHNYSWKDFVAWFPKLKVGGKMAFHDSTGGWPKVEETVKKAQRHENCELIHVFGTISLLRRV